MRTLRFQARWPGHSSIRGRSGPRVSSTRLSRNWARAGCRFCRRLTKRAWISAFELHPGEDLHDGVTFERFLAVVGEHPRANILYDPSHMILQQMDYLAFLDIYHDRVRAFHVKDAEYQAQRPLRRLWRLSGLDRRPGRFRSLGDGQIDFSQIFSKMAQYDYPGWAVMEWECCLKHPEAGAAEGAPFIRDHIIRVTDRAFDDFAGGGADTTTNRKILGL